MNQEQARSIAFSLHDLYTGDTMHIKNFQPTGGTQLAWEGPFQVLLTTSTAIKLGERTQWIHYLHVKRGPSIKSE